MSRKREEARKQHVAGQKGVKDLRRGLLLAHLVLGFVLIGATKLVWYSLFVKEKLAFDVVGLSPESPYVSQAQALILGAVTALFFTSYDLVADADLQWPQLVVSAFALGCCGQVCYRLDESFSRTVDQIVRVEMAKEQAARSASPGAVAPATSASAIVAGTSAATQPAATQPAASVALLSSATLADVPAPVRLKIDLGLKLALFASASMTLLSVYLTFFARRAT